MTSGGAVASAAVLLGTLTIGGPQPRAAMDSVQDGSGPSMIEATRAAVPRRVMRGLDLYMPVPSDNPMTREAIALGRRLFFERRLSRDGSMSCSTCHNPSRAFAGGGRTAIGIDRQLGPRNVPTLVNRGYGRSFFWDGRAATLEKQVLQPITNRIELGSSLDDVMKHLASDESYRSDFQAAFGREPAQDDLARALASYLRTITSGDSPFDRVLERGRRALSDDARRGLDIFQGRGNCWLCHAGPTLSDEQFHNTGVAWRRGEPGDAGRAGVTGRTEDRGAFKTPTLREVARTAPYMHDGSMKTLADVVDHYDRGGFANPLLDGRLRPLNLTRADKQALVALLKSFNGRVVEGAD